MLMMYLCKQCGQFSLLGYVNEHKEHFCSQRCYERYCMQHGYTPHSERLMLFKNEENNSNN